MKVAAVVILYNPPSDVIAHVRSYVPWVESLYVVDNSDIVNHAVVRELEGEAKVIYIRNDGNLGIASALNIGAYRAMAHSFDFLLTMDQDSGFADGQFKELLEVVKRSDLTQVGIVSPAHGTVEVKDASSRQETVAVPFTMTSGNMLRLSAFRATGPFDDSLFIDHVDHDYCFKLHGQGFKVLLVPGIILKHQLGTIRQARLLWFPIFSFVSHSPLRTYYIIRNGLIVANRHRQQFPFFYAQNMKTILLELLKIVFERDKWRRIKLSWLAVQHYLSAKTGKLEY